jgi:hypothetical protein
MSLDMISIGVYRVIHLWGVFLILFSLGGLLVFSINGGTRQTNKWRMPVALTHGIGMTLALLGGFGLHARLGIEGFPLWIWAKILIWLFSGLALGIIFRKAGSAKVLWWSLAALTLVAAILGQFKPV